MSIKCTTAYGGIVWAPGSPTAPPLATDSNPLLWLQNFTISDHLNNKAFGTTHLEGIGKV